MPYGAHEAMEAHEILGEKICMIDHFSMYAQQCQDPVLRNMIDRHLQYAIQSYNELVSYTHDYHAVSPQAAQISQVANPQSIQYGLRNPAPASPQMNTGRFTDQQIAVALLCAHKNSAKNHMSAALECSDPNLRQLMVNSANACAHQAFEVFQYMNQKGWYQVPTLETHTAKTMLHRHQPVASTQGTTAPYMPPRPMYISHPGQQGIPQPPHGYQ
ncbi:coat protein F [Collibacillus ludicampi]|uniref:Coat protein F n=1 Tax=Collibacillus ludicampi TaxID=2771369 RepID=A0AAV4LBA0_9BACL|nr:spore coat protein [Collibacillus ludicampi]GIM45062.1 coat protein F [Collibacillus ludicampi]